MRRPFAILFLLLCALPAAYGQMTAPGDTVKIDSTVLTARRNSSLLMGQKGVGSTVRTELLQKAPMLLGNSNPVRFVQSLPGVTSGTELDAGLHIQGTEHQHNLISVEGIPIYGATHLLGLFSVFIPNHYGSMSYTTCADSDNRLGGVVDMSLPEEMPARTTGAVSAGLLATEGTVKLPLGKHFSMALSARKSYINALYSSFLRLGENRFRYSFADADLTLNWAPSADDRIVFDNYGGRDILDYGNSDRGMDVDLDWYNQMSALHWKHRGDGWKLDQSVYRTVFDLGMDVNHDFFKIDIPSGIASFGYKAAFGAGGWDADLHIAHHTARPQSVSSHGEFFADEIPEDEQQALEATARLRRTFAVTPSWEVGAGAKAILYRSAGRTWTYLCPEFRTEYNFGRGGILGAALGMQRQVLFQTGLTSIALPYEFWMLAGKYSDPQGSLYAHLRYDNSTILGNGYHLSAELHYRKLSNQLEYRGSLLDFVRKGYSLDNSLLKGSGRNYGISLMLSKQTGPLTGWIGYTLQRSLRSSDDPALPAEYPSSHERIHELNATAIRSWNRWDLSASLVAASGIPFTAANSLYVQQNMLLCNFGQYNAERFKPYVRIDLSVNYYFSRSGDGRENGINFSLYNATGRKNDIFYRINYTEDARFNYSSMYYKIMFLPSIGYFHRF